MSDDRPPEDRDRTADATGDAPADASSPADRADGQRPDGGRGEERPPEQEETAPETDERPEPEREPDRANAASGGRSDRIAFWVSALIGLALAAGSIAFVSGWAPFFEEILRIRPTVEGGGIGADWVAGNTETVLEWLIVLVHFADVVMGIFILLMVFIHWAAFRRLGARMQPPGGTRTQEAAAATDGGDRTKSDDRGDGREFGGDRS
ncbi:hypothetical protein CHINAEXTREME_00125 [Halobiforma lacisalsi AJ5]|uniref:Uncharacterized protein n=1 Tax=Natronobacterium lacisalsi AJ5 TaxID=358396 RepID=M0LWC1_NATLA|nr:hypothetical protein [Halobiforma lacisalsi]APW96262.1 hypothetical protein CHINAEXTREME_00125 [Halobiforma lacisalsi AJ5]EMA36395.1 hypothetical protein C445_03153 [Halobiforma lacisalsi AJ5]